MPSGSGELTPRSSSTSPLNSDSVSVLSVSDIDYYSSLSPTPSASSVPSGPSSSVSISSAPSGAEDEDEESRERRNRLYCHYVVRDTSQEVIENKRKAFPEPKEEGSCEMFRYYHSKESGGIVEVGGGIPLLLIDYITLAEKSSDEKNSANDYSPSVKFGKAWIKNQNIGDDCTVGGWLHWFDVPNNTRVHIDEEGAKDIENYRILVEKYFVELLQRESSAMTKESFLNQIKEFTSIQHIHNYGEDDAGRGVKTFADMFGADIDKTAKELAKTFLVNNLLRGIYRTEVVNLDNVEDKEFAFVKIERPQDGNSRINVTVGSKLSDRLSRVNVAVGNGIFAQLRINSNDDKATVMNRAEGVNYFKHNKVHDNFDPIPFKQSRLWGDNRSKILGPASTPIIKTTYLRRDITNERGETESKESDSFKLENGGIKGDGKLWGGQTRVSKTPIWGPTAAPIKVGDDKADIGEDFGVKYLGSKFSFSGLWGRTFLGKSMYTISSVEDTNNKVVVSSREKFMTTIETKDGKVTQMEVKKNLTSGWGVSIKNTVKLEDYKIIPNTPSTSCAAPGVTKMSTIIPSPVTAASHV